MSPELDEALMRRLLAASDAYDYWDAQIQLAQAREEEAMRMKTEANQEFLQVRAALVQSVLAAGRRAQEGSDVS